jgi:PAS domain S-box-containing protein
MQGARDVRGHGWAERVLASALDAVVTIGADGHVLDWNPAAEGLFGYSREQAVGQPLADLIIPPEQQAGHWAGLLRLVSGGEPRILDRRVEMFARDSRGQEIPVELTVTQTQEEPVLFTGFVRDLSALKQAQRDALRMAEVLEEGEELSGAGSWQHDFRTGVSVWSAGMYSLHGYERGGRPLELDALIEDVHPDDRDKVRQVIGRMFSDPSRFAGQENELEWRIVRPDGAVRHLRGRGRVWLDEEGKPARFLGSAMDMTGWRQTERRLSAYNELEMAFATWASRDEGYFDLLRRLGLALDYPMGSMWTWDHEADELACRAFWTAPGVDAGDFEVATRRTVLKRGDGVPGRVWETLKPVVSDDVTSMLHFRRAGVAAGIGLQSGLAFPAIGSRGPIAVVCFYAFERRGTSEEFSQTLEGLGMRLGQFLEEREAQLGPQPLSAREREVLQLAAEGNTGQEIADKLTLSALTVKTHFANIYEKLGVGDRAAAVAYAFRMGLIR